MILLCIYIDLHNYDVSLFPINLGFDMHCYIILTHGIFLTYPGHQLYISFKHEDICCLYS